MTADLPEWALEKARECAAKYHEWAYGTTLKHSTDELAGFIARALVSAAKAERERAAGIARAYRHGNPFPTIQDAIATAILADGGSDAG